MTKNKLPQWVLYALGLVGLFLLIYLSIAFIQLEINAFNWSGSTRVGYVFTCFSVAALYIPIVELIKLN